MTMHSDWFRDGPMTRIYWAPQGREELSVALGLDSVRTGAVEVSSHLGLWGEQDYSKGLQ